MTYGTIFLNFMLLLLTYRCTDGMTLNSSDENFTKHEDWADLKLPEIFENCSSYIVEKEYILLENGSLLLPYSDHAYAYETYFVQNDTAFLCAEDDPETEERETNTTKLDLSDEFLECGHVLIGPEEYELLDNGSVYIDIYSTVYGPRDYYYVEDSGVYICTPSYNDFNSTVSQSRYRNKFSESFEYVTCVGLVLSIISLVAYLAVFCLVSSLRNLPGCCLANLSFSLLVAYSCFLAMGLPKTSEHCANLGLTIYYFFLTSFFWMNAIAFDVWRSFRVVMRELRISSHRVPWRRFLLYSLYSWLVPGMLVALVKFADNTDWLPEDYKPSFAQPHCWFGSRKALLVFFAVPLCLVMLLNAGFFLDVTYVISRATLKTTPSNEATLKKRFFMFMRLALIMGLTWIVGLVAGYADNQYLWYLFIILNTLQGLFIFIVFSFSTKVRNILFKKRSKSRGSTSVRTISQFSAAV